MKSSSAIRVGVDVGGTSVKLGLVRGARILAQESFLTLPYAASPKRLETALVDAVRGICRRHGAKPRSVGVGIPGLVEYPRGIVDSCVNLRGWRRVPLRANLRRRLGLPVRVDNDVNAMTLAEWKHGAGRGALNLLCVTLGTGVGGGLVINGALYRSRKGPSGEIGHLPLGEEGPACFCGGTACLERYVGNREIVAEVRRRIRAGERSKISGLVEGRLERIRPEVIDRACGMGDPLARETWRRAGERIGLVLVDAVNLLNPDRIVIGGGLAKAGRWLFGPIRETLGRRAMRGIGRVPVVPAQLGPVAGIIGASLLPLEPVHA